MTIQSPVLLITGGTGGIGAETARLASKRGYDVWISYFTNETAANELENKFGIRAVKADLSDEQDIVRMFETIDHEAGHLDGLVNNAGVPGARQTILDLNLKNLEAVFRVNTFGTFLCSREAARRMATSLGGLGGAIVNLSSQAVSTGGYQLSPYAASKASVATLTTSLASELADEGIRVNSVTPGIIDTNQQVFGSRKRREKQIENIPLRRMGKPTETAEAILWLLSNAASYVTGADIVVSGGR